MLETRKREGGAEILRRRECTACGARFRTVERLVYVYRQSQGKRKHDIRPEVAALIDRITHQNE